MCESSVFKRWVKACDSVRSSRNEERGKKTRTVP